MKRLPLLFTFLAVVALSASLAYWGLQWWQPPQRPLAPAPRQAAAEASVDAARGLFGGLVTQVAASNYQLRGVVAAGNNNGGNSDSAAIVAIDGKPAAAIGLGREVAPGVTLKEIHPKYVMLSEAGALKRVELASDVGPRGDPNVAAPTMPRLSVSPTTVSPPPPPPVQPERQ